MSETARIRVLDYQGTGSDAAKLCSPEGAVAVFSLALFEKVGRYICYPRPVSVATWGTLDGVPTNLLRVIHEQYPLQQPPRVPDERELAATFKGNPTVIGTGSDMQ